MLGIRRVCDAAEKQGREDGKRGVWERRIPAHMRRAYLRGWNETCPPELRRTSWRKPPAR